MKVDGITVGEYVWVDGVRHGPKDGDTLTDDGFAFVKATAEEHHRGRAVHPVAFHSGKNRAEQTARTIMGIARHPGEGEDVAVVRHELFAYDWLEDKDAGWPEFDEGAVMAELDARGGGTLRDLLELYQPSWRFGPQIAAGILDVANQAIHSTGPGCTIIVGGHGWFLETAAPNKPVEVALMEMGDVYRYKVVMSPGGLHIAEAQLLKCPCNVTD